MKQKFIALCQVSPDISDDSISQFINERLSEEMEQNLHRARIFGIKPIGKPEFNQDGIFYRLVQKTEGNKLGYFLDSVFNTRRFPWHYLRNRT